MRLPLLSERMLSPEQCRALASEFKTISLASTTSGDRAFIMKNISRTLMGLATQLDLLATKMRDEAR